MSIKRFVSALLTGALCLGVLTACGSAQKPAWRERRRPAVQHHLL